MSAAIKERPLWNTATRSIVPVVVLVLVFFLLVGTLKDPARWALAITAGTLAAWVLEPVPLAATSIPIIFMLAATGAAKPGSCG